MHPPQKDLHEGVDRGFVLRSRLTRDRVEHWGQILGAMLHFIEQQIHLFSRSAAFSDVTRHLRGADDPTLCVADRGDSEADLDQATILAAAYGVEMLDALAGPDAPQDFGL